MRAIFLLAAVPMGFWNVYAGVGCIVIYAAMVLNEARRL